MQVPVAPTRNLTGQLLRGRSLLVERLFNLLAALGGCAGHRLQQRVEQGIAQLLLVHDEAEQVEVVPFVAAVELRGLGAQHVLGIVGDGLVREAQSLPERLQLLEELPQGRKMGDPFANFLSPLTLADTPEKGERVTVVRVRLAGAGFVGVSS